MKKLSYLLIVLLTSYCSYAQNASVKGTVTDTLNKQNLNNAVISLLRKSDSVLYKFSRSTASGQFSMNNLKQGKYVVLVSYPGYADYYDTLTLGENTTADLGNVMVTTKAHLLSDVTVVQKIAAIRMKGDTIVFKADSFKLREGASVEDLLKKFPGIQVDKNGNITAMGTKVEKVLVDGEEFFGDDPTIATKNLDAKMVNEVQVFDKKSDQAAFTGIDDGQTTRTINLKLKDDAKKGWFGKLETGVGPDDRWNNSLMANTFKNKRKLSIYGIASSTGKTGLDWDEQGKFGGDGSNNMTMTDDGGMYYSNGGDPLNSSNYWGEGIPKSWSGGLNYTNKYNNDKATLNGSYRYAKVINNGSGTTISQSILPDTLFFNNERRNVYGNKDRHSVNGSYDWMVDSSFSVKLTLNGTKGRTQGSSNYYSEALNAAGQYVNQSRRNNSSEGDNQSLKGSLLVRKRFKKDGRTLSLNVDHNYNDVNTSGFLYAANDYFDKGGIRFAGDTTDQKKQNESNNNTFNSRLSYTEKLAKKLTMELSYGFTSSKYSNKILSFDKTATGKYEVLNTRFSNNYDFTVLTNKAGTMLRYNDKKLSVSAGGDVAFADFKQEDLIKDTVTQYSFTNLFPRAEITYKFNANKRLSIRYNGNTKQPTIQQIQPVADNTNPLYVQVGNPNLKQEFNHRFNLNFNSYNVLKQRGMYMGSSFGTTSNAIRNNLFTDTVGKTITQYINVGGNYYFNVWGGYNTKITKWEIDLNINYSFNQNTNISFVNGQKNETNSNNHDVSFYFYKSKEKVFDLWFYTGFGYNMSKSSIRKDINTNYWSMNHGFEFTLQLPWKFEFNTNAEFNIREKTELFANNNSISVINGYIARKFLKNDKAQLRFSAFDILNQNVGYSRNINSTMLTENSYQQLARYFLVSVIWNFSKGGAMAK